MRKGRAGSPTVRPRWAARLSVARLTESESAAKTRWSH